MNKWKIGVTLVSHVKKQDNIWITLVATSLEKTWGLVSTGKVATAVFVSQFWNWNIIKIDPFFIHLVDITHKQKHQTSFD